MVTEHHALEVNILTRTQDMKPGSDTKCYGLDQMSKALELTERVESNLIIIYNR